MNQEASSIWFPLSNLKKGTVTKVKIYSYINQTIALTSLLLYLLLLWNRSFLKPMKSSELRVILCALIEIIRRRYIAVFADQSNHPKMRFPLFESGAFLILSVFYLSKQLPFECFFKYRLTLWDALYILWKAFYERF